MIYDNLAISITRKCTASCDICCFSCNPQRTEILNDDAIENVILQLKKYYQIKTITFTGGEPMLNPDRVLKLAEKAKEAEKRVALYTNGFWCEDKEYTRKIINKLKKYNLFTILTSIDIFHQKYVPLSSIKNLIDVSKEFGIDVKIHSSVIKSSTESTDRLIQELGEKKLGIPITESAVLPIGRALSLETKEIVKEVNFRNAQCHFDGMCNIDWNGNVFPCCSQCENSNLILGNIYEDKIITILNNVRKSPFFHLILKYGLDIIASFVKENNLHLINDRYADSCELCHDLFQNVSLIKQLLEFHENHTLHDYQVQMESRNTEGIDSEE